MPTDYTKLDILCPACNENHDDLEFGTQVNGDAEFPYVGRCPTTGRIVYAKTTDHEAWCPVPLNPDAACCCSFDGIRS